MFKNLHPFFIVIAIGLLGLLGIVVLNDIWLSIKRNQPLSYDVVVLIKMAMCAVLGVAMGYLARGK